MHSLTDLPLIQTNEKRTRIHQNKVSGTSLNLITSNTLRSVKQNSNSPIVQNIISWEYAQSINQKDKNVRSKIIKKLKNKQNLEKNTKQKYVKIFLSNNESGRTNENKRLETNNVMDIAVKKKPNLINDEQMLIPEDEIWADPNEKNECSKNEMTDETIIGELES